MSFEKNVGQTDRLIRTILGLYAMLLGFLFIQGWLGILIGVIGVIALVTGLVGWCGLYKLLGKSTIEPDEPTQETT